MEKVEKAVEGHFDWKSVKNGIISSFAAISLTQPFQVIRSNMMINYLKNKPVGFVWAINTIYTNEGIKGFYRSIAPAMLRVPINGGIFFSSLEFFKKVTPKIFKGLNHHQVNSVSSAMSRTVSCSCLNPLLIIITRFEMVGFNAYSSTFNGIIKIYREEGFRGYFKGLRVLLTKEVPTAAIFYPVYELNKKFIKSLGYNTQVQSSVSAFSANTILTLLNNPLDVIRTRLQYLHYSHNQNHDYKGVFSGLKKLIQTEGYRGYFVGVIPRLLKRTMGSSIAWTVYETLKERNNWSI